MADAWIGREDFADSMVTVPPAPCLRDAVHSYRAFDLAKYRPHALSAVDGFVRLIVFFDSMGGRDTSTARPMGPRVSFESLRSGLDVTGAEECAEIRGSGIEVVLEPWAVSGLFGIPSEHLTSALRMRDEPGGVAPVHSLAEKLLDATDLGARRGVLDRELARRLATGPPCPVPLRRAWQRLADDGGTMPIPRLAAAVGWSQNQLCRHFRAQIGLAPKGAARLLRLRRALRLLDGGHPGIRVAADCGFYDQAHLSRECAALTGLPPTGFLAATRARGRARRVHVPFGTTGQDGEFFQDHTELR
ncbi:helix-turn-helix domain-containing protein [Embleya sp. NPDC050493]|uniref:helix-turn-helix domain-containing protein n=1 Tax=Embleya sp. NPDC050493 TaxID=3363989 RepID=UPI0037B54B06